MASFLPITEFQIWRPSYGGATVTAYVGGTTMLAALYTDTDLSIAAENPQTLMSQTANGVNYGKFAVPLYTNDAYSLDIESTDQTGVTRPSLTSLAAEDASLATVATARGETARALEDMLDQTIFAEDFGVIGASSATNTTTINAALGAAAAQGGGEVVLPAGTIPITTLSLAAGVVLRGQGRLATIVTSSQASNVVTIGGAQAGLRDLTLDGLTLPASSVGVYGAAKSRTVLERVQVKRFDTGISLPAATYQHWLELFVSNCGTGVATPGSGGEAAFIFWDGGAVDTCSVDGVRLAYVDAQVRHVTLRGVFFDTNSDKALRLTGARFVQLENCRWSGNVGADIITADGVGTNATLQNIEVVGGRFDAGALTIAGTCQDVAFRRVSFGTEAIALTQTNPIVLEDCVETAVTVTGLTQFIERRHSWQDGEFSIVTTDATVTSVWEQQIAPGQAGFVVAKVVANRRNGADYAIYHIEVGFRRAGSTLAYDGQTVNFTAGLMVTGGTSGAMARIESDSDSGATGTLTLKEITGTFLDNEAITDTGGGAAVVNGAIATGSLALDGTALTSLRTAAETDSAWACILDASGTNMRCRVTGAAAKTVLWKPSISLQLVD